MVPGDTTVGGKPPLARKVKDQQSNKLYQVNERQTLAVAGWTMLENNASIPESQPFCPTTSRPSSLQADWRVVLLTGAEN